MPYTIIETCIGCTACTKRCPTGAISGERNIIHVIDPELCINICPFDALSLQHPETVSDFFGVATLDPRKCTGCRLCEDACGWGAIYIDPPRELLKKPLAESVA